MLESNGNILTFQAFGAFHRNSPLCCGVRHPRLEFQLSLPNSDSDQSLNYSELSSLTGSTRLVEIYLTRLLGRFN